MKKIINSLAIVLTVFTLSTSRPANAAVGALVAMPLMISTGIAIAAGGGAATVPALGCMTFRGGEKGLVATLVLGIYGLVAIGVGAMVLDGEQHMEFAPVTPAQAAKLHLTKAEMNAYNSEVDQVNALADMIGEDLGRMENPTNEDSANAWNDVKDTLAPQTFSALAKIVTAK
jgi:hypothetical protein